MQSYNQNLIECFHRFVFEKMKMVVIITDIEISTCVFWFRLSNKPKISFYQNLKQKKQPYFGDNHVPSDNAY